MSINMDYIEICNWTTFQHYKKRNPPWIKLYASLLDDDEFYCLPDASKLLYMCLLIFASRQKNQIKLDFTLLQRKLPIETPLCQETLQPLMDKGFVNCYQGASNGLETCKHSAMPEKRRDRDREKKKLFPISGKTCSKCSLPAVYKDTSGAYDHHYCLDHSPASVREMYE